MTCQSARRPFEQSNAGLGEAPVLGRSPDPVIAGVRAGTGEPHPFQFADHLNVESDPPVATCLRARRACIPRR